MKVIGKQGGTGRVQDAESQQLMRLVQGLKYEQTESAARQILLRNPRNPLAHRALTFALACLGRHEEVVATADRALQISPGDGEVHNNRAIALSMLMRWDEAIGSFQIALRHSPADPEIHKNLGAAYLRMQKWNEAVPVLLKAIELHPGDYLEAVVMLASALTNANRHEEAAVCVNALCDEHPDRLEFIYDRLALSLRRCDWGAVDSDVARLQANLGDLDQAVSSPWWVSWFWFLGAEDRLRVSRNFATEAIGKGLLESNYDLPLRWNPGERRLRVGYLSADFRNHAVAVVVSEAFERHNRELVEIFGYSLCENDGSEERERLIRSVEHFVDMAAMPVHGVANRIRADGIDILVDLTGWMSGGRVESLALRCAPVQVSWLGYAGTLGHPKLADYIIGDPIAIPFADQVGYTEQIACMPNSFMPADTTRLVAEPPTRQSQGLPEAAFVMCSFNNSYKFNPPLFDLWCRLLREMPDAVLWLPRHNDTVAANLRKEVYGRGVSPERLVFAERIGSPSAHLGRLQLADLALDTFPYNSHSTGVDVLWAGVPMVAKLGTSFAGRVGASLLSAAGLPELIALDDDGYAKIAFELYSDRPRLHAMRERLRLARTSAPLFDMKRFAEDLEGLYFKFAECARERQSGKSTNDAH